MRRVELQLYIEAWSHNTERQRVSFVGARERPSFERLVVPHDLALELWRASARERARISEAATHRSLVFPHVRRFHVKW